MDGTRINSSGSPLNDDTVLVALSSAHFIPFRGTSNRFIRINPLSPPSSQVLLVSSLVINYRGPDR